MTRNYENRRIWTNNHASTHDLLGDHLPRVTREDAYKEAEDEIFTTNLLRRFDKEPIKQEFIKHLIQGYNFHQIGEMLNMKTGQTYKIKRELKEQLKDLLPVLKNTPKEKVVEKLKKDKNMLKVFSDYMAIIAKQTPLKEFNDLYIYAYHPEALANGWKAIELQNTYEKIWNEHQKSCSMFPREHLKTHTVMSYLIKRIFTRQYPLEIDYYHLNKEMAQAKIRIFKNIVRGNPLLEESFDLDNARSDSEDKLILRDGTIITPLSYTMGVVGKHPHIIVLDDVIDRKVIYSNERNQKAIDKFYMDIYPMISQDDPEKRIIIIGTAQREDDLYHSLPEDVYVTKHKAVDEETKTVLAPDLYTYEHLMKIKKNVSAKHGIKYWLKEYQNETYNAMELIIRRADIQFYDPTEIPSDFKKTMRVQYWDLSVGKDLEKGDYTACCTLDVYENEQKQVRYYIEDLYRARIDFATRVNQIDVQATAKKPNIIGVENNVFQFDTVQEAKKKTKFAVIGIKTISNKIEKFRMELAPHFENKKVYINKNIPIVNDIVNELLGLPIGEYDDMGDCITGAIKLTQAKPPEPRIRRLGV